MAADGGPGERLPVRVVFEAADSSYRYSVADESDEAAYATDPELRVSVQRVGSTRAIALGIVAMMWALAISVAYIAWLVATRSRWRSRAFEGLAWMGAMLFALVEIRGAAPGAPAFGTLFDFIGFFWAEIITAVSLCVVVFVQFAHERTPDA